MASIWYAVGSSGQIRKSTDSGATWSIFTSPTSRIILCVHGIDADNVWIGTVTGGGGTSAYIYYWNGSTWTLQYTGPTDYHIEEIYMASATEGYAILQQTTINGSQIAKWNGTAWSIVDNHGSEKYFGGIFADGNGNVIVGGNANQGGGIEQIRYSTNSGSTWNDGADDHFLSTVGVWIDSGTWHYMERAPYPGTSYLRSSSDPSVAFSSVTTITNPHAVAENIWGFDNTKLWYDGSGNWFYVSYNGATSSDELGIWNGSTHTYHVWGPQNRPAYHIFGVNSSDVKLCCSSDIIVDYNGSTTTERDIRQGGTSANYYGIYGIEFDGDPPYLDNEDPAPSATGVDVDKDIVFNLKDDDSGVDQSTVIIQIHRGSGWEIVWSSDTEQLSDVTVTKNVISAGNIQYTIDPDLVFPWNQTVQVRVQADDLFVPTNSLDTTYSFQTDTTGGADTDPPYLDNKDPVDGKINVALNSTVTFDIIDLKHSIDQSSVIIQINRYSTIWETIWTGDTQQPGFSVTKTVLSSNQVRYVIDPVANFVKNQTVQIRVQADDTATSPNSMDETYDFETVLGNIWMAVGASGQIRYSLDGTNWLIHSTPTSRNIGCIHGYDANNIWIGTEPPDGTVPDIYYWNGETWTLQFSYSTDAFAKFAGIWAVSATEVYAITRNIYTTRPFNLFKFNGVSWSSIDSGNSGGYCVVSNGNNILFGMHAGFGPNKDIRYSTDGGSSFANGIDQKQANHTYGVWIMNNTFHYYKADTGGGAINKVFYSTDPSISFSELFAAHPGYIFGQTEYGNPLYGDGGDLFLPAKFGAVDEAICHWKNGTQFYYIVTYKPNSVKGISKTDVKFACNTNTIVNYDGENTPTETNIQLGGTSANYFDIYGYEEPAVDTTTNTQLTIRNVAYDHLRLYFSTPVASTSELVDVSNYMITAITSGAVVIEAVSVLGVDPTEGNLLSFVDLEITRATLNARYEIEIVNLKGADDKILVTNQNDGVVGYFVSRKTKVDSLLASVPRMYDTSIGSVFRTIITAIAFEDERIAGEDNISPLLLNG